MVQFDSQQHALVGQAGTLAVAANDEMARKLAMLIEGECEGLGPVKAAEKFGYTRQRYHQIRCDFLQAGRRGIPVQGTRPQAELPPHPGGGSPGPAASLSRSGGHGRSDCPKATAVGHGRSVSAVWNASSPITGFKKKLYKCRPAATTKNLISPSRRRCTRAGETLPTAIRGASNAA